ncbi:MAG: HAMP domain-containing histidine kinase [Candidatus Zixiibacteriota bacterium]|nr:MAG: HAMP domain-containing histidine kinase [candidate division Zixibacteria bacterium]
MTPKRALILFIAITVVLIGQATWWIIFMARLVDEKVQMAIDLGADPAFVDTVHHQEIHRQIMVGSEGVFMLILVGLGAWLIYRALVRAEELKFHQQNFLMAVTHELKTPLASIKVYLDSLQSSKISAEKKAAIIPHLRQDADRLEKLVENVLEASRFERSGYRVSRENFDFSRMVDGLLEDMKRCPSKKPVTVKKTKFKEDILVYGDPAALRRTVEAILDNALRYNDKDAVEIEVELTSETPSVCLRICDNGAGLTRSDIHRIFERFYRGGENISHSQPGSGLGLYLCREIIRAHGGRIRAESDGPGKGTCISIKLREKLGHENDTSR